MAQAYPDMCITVRLADLKAAALEMARQIRSDAETERRSRESAAGCTLMAAEDVAAALKVSSTTLWRWGKQGVLHPVKIGGGVYYRQDEIRDIIDAEH